MKSSSEYNEVDVNKCLRVISQLAVISLENRFRSDEMYRCAIFLWTKFRQLRMLTPKKQIETKKDIKKWLIAMCNIEEDGSSSTCEDSPDLFSMDTIQNSLELTGKYIGKFIF